MGQPATVTGTCDAAFAAVRDEFAANFTERGELGAAICIIAHGSAVADLYGGWGSPGQPWSPDTLVNVFSVGKGLIAACTARLIGQGLLDPDERVTSYWPEFGAAGKQDVTVRQLLSHQAGLPALHAALPNGSMLDWDRMSGLLAAEEPWWQPGSGHGYHVNTFGFLAGELIRLVTGLTPGEYLRREVAGPLGADVHIGLGAADLPRVADFHWEDGLPDFVPPADSGASGVSVPADVAVVAGASGTSGASGASGPGASGSGADALMALNAYPTSPAAAW